MGNRNGGRWGFIDLIPNCRFSIAHGELSEDEGTGPRTTDRGLRDHLIADCRLEIADVRKREGRGQNAVGRRRKAEGGGRRAEGRGEDISDCGLWNDSVKREE